MWNDAQFLPRFEVIEQSTKRQASSDGYAALATSIKSSIDNVLLSYSYVGSHSSLLVIYLDLIANPITDL